MDGSVICGVGIAGSVGSSFGAGVVRVDGASLGDGEGHRVGAGVGDSEGAAVGDGVSIMSIRGAALGDCGVLLPRRIAASHIQSSKRQATVPSVVFDTIVCRRHCRIAISSACYSKRSANSSFLLHPQYKLDRNVAKKDTFTNNSGIPMRSSMSF